MAAWAGWLIAAALLVSLADLSWALRSSIVILVCAVAGRTLWSYVLLRGARAVRALEWGPDVDMYYVLLGAERKRVAAIPAGCRRYGRYLWLLRFSTGSGVVQVLVDPACQEPRALRTLARRLFGRREAPDARRSGRPAASS